MKRIFLPALLLAACGIPEEVHVQSVRDLEKCRQDLNNASGDLAVASAEIEAEKTKPEGESRLGSGDTERVEFEHARQALAKRSAQWQRLRTELKPLTDAKKIRLETRKSKLLVRLSGKLLFEPGR